jgi:hypothetical protein
MARTRIICTLGKPKNVVAAGIARRNNIFGFYMDHYRYVYEGFEIFRSANSAIDKPVI